jgi:hypothetical protein
MAAGLGFKTFTTGEVLTAGDVNGYLMQGVLVFASEAARNSAITSPQEGQFAYTKDNNSLWYYTGSAWAASGATGDIEGVTAGVGISGGGTSGTVTITNSMATAIDAKGDLVAGTGADTFSRLGVGANGTILTADSAEATGLKWAAAAGGGGGKVLQVVQGTTTTELVTTSTSLVDTGITATITPTSATSKILVMIMAHNASYRDADGQFSGAAVLRGGTTIMNYATDKFGGISATGATIVFRRWFSTLTYLDSPATTSATTYKLQASISTSANSAFLVMQGGSSLSTIILMEIGA